MTVEAARSPRTTSSSAAEPGARALAGALGLGAAASMFAGGLYDLGDWAPAALGGLALLVALVVGRPALPSGPAAVALGALVGLAAWALISTGWAESDGQAYVEAARWAMYAAMLAALLLLGREPGVPAAFLGGSAAGVVLVSGWLLVKMAAGDGRELFPGGRLDEPVGYVNAVAGYMLVALWPLVAAMEGARRALSAAAVAAAAALVSCTLVLTQTRAILPALAVSAAVALLVPGRRRRLLAMVVVAGSSVLALPSLIEVYDQTRNSRLPSDAALRDAAVASALASLVAGLVWAFGQRAWRAVADRSAGAARLVPRLAVALIVIGVVGGAALATTSVDVGEEYRSFTNLRTDPDRGTRFLTGGGNRYDYWRIAWDEFRDHPVRGVGAGNYDVAYFRERRQTEEIRQPHSIQLQSLSELGLVGGLLVAGLIAAVYGGFLLGVRRRTVDPLVLAASGGAFTAWLVHTSVDWMHLLPGLTLMALGAAASMLSPWVRPGGSGSINRALAAVCLVLVVAAAAGIGRLAAADRELRDGQGQIKRSPAGALAAADRALALNSAALSSYYLKAAALARMNRYEESRATLLAASEREPHDFVPYGLLGDLAVRRGDVAEARRWYSKARALNPRDPVLTQLVQNPLLALERPR